ncbi:MAG: bifunctional riboflavin kinase/FAD synthetase [Candidatus Acidiferrales bacterium]
MTLAVLHSPAEWKARFGADARCSAVTIGNFDGVHLGHQEILRRVVERARRESLRATVVTLDPHPLRVLRPNDAPALLATLDQRLAKIEVCGLDAVLVLRFDAELARLSPREFIEQIVIGTLRTRAILVGNNFRFGHRGAGNIVQLRQFGQEFGFEVECIDPVVCRGEVVSSTAIRRAVSEGRLTDALRFLGRPYSLAGAIQPGTGQGRRFVVPTLNLRTAQELLPKTGVYATEVSVKARKYRAVTNVGMRPTFDGKGLTVESFLFDFEEQIASGPLEVSFWARLRDEMKFSGPDALRAQIVRDAERARRFFRLVDRSGLTRQSA